MASDGPILRPPGLRGTMGARGYGGWCCRGRGWGAVGQWAWGGRASIHFSQCGPSHLVRLVRLFSCPAQSHQLRCFLCEGLPFSVYKQFKKINARWGYFGGFPRCGHSKERATTCPQNSQYPAKKDEHPLDQHEYLSPQRKDRTARIGLCVVVLPYVKVTSIHIDTWLL